MRQLPGQEHEQLALEQQLRVLRHSAQQHDAQVFAAEPEAAVEHVAVVVAAAAHRKQELLPLLLLAVVLVQQGPAAGWREETAGSRQAGNWRLLGQHTLP